MVLVRAGGWSLRIWLSTCAPSNWWALDGSSPFLTQRWVLRTYDSRDHVKRFSSSPGCLVHRQAPILHPSCFKHSLLTLLIGLPAVGYALRNLVHSKIQPLLEYPIGLHLQRTVVSHGKTIRKTLAQVALHMQCASRVHQFWMITPWTKPVDVWPVATLKVQEIVLVHRTCERVRCMTCWA